MLRSMRFTPSPMLARRVLSRSSSQYPILSYRRTNNVIQHGISTHERVLLLFAGPMSRSMLESRRLFHSTSRREGACFPVLAFLKMSTAIPLVTTISRVSLTFLPALFLNRWKDRHLRGGEPHPYANSQNFFHKIRIHGLLFHTLLLTPVALIFLTLLASLERAPLTGRWRMMLLSPEEEHSIAAQLAGPGWFAAVSRILAPSGSPGPTLIPPSDWRHAWVVSTLRRLESAIPVLQAERELVPDWMDERGPDDIPRPPPAIIPLYSRPRMSEYAKRWSELVGLDATKKCSAGEEIAGPPYSLLVVDRPDASNAFSYGFGADGAGGVVVFSGFIDDVLKKFPFPDEPPVPPERSSWLSSLFGSFFAFDPPARPQPVPTEEQTSELAILLAHELAHLLLSHHIETLSSGSIVAPGVMSLAADVVRTIIFPVTMFLGPFINDALAGVGKASSSEIAKLSEYRTSQKQEIEADLVSARLLAHAGFDPRQAIRFWESRQETPQTADCSPAHAGDFFAHDESPPHRWMGDSHPMHKVRVQKLKEELDRWEDERRRAREEKQMMGKARRRPVYKENLFL